MANLALQCSSTSYFEIGINSKVYEGTDLAELQRLAAEDFNRQLGLLYSTFTDDLFTCGSGCKLWVRSNGSDGRGQEIEPHQDPKHEIWHLATTEGVGTNAHAVIKVQAAAQRPFVVACLDASKAQTEIDAYMRQHVRLLEAGTDEAGQDISWDSACLLDCPSTTTFTRALSGTVALTPQDSGNHERSSKAKNDWTRWVQTQITELEDALKLVFKCREGSSECQCGKPLITDNFGTIPTPYGVDLGKAVMVTFTISCKCE